MLQRLTRALSGPMRAYRSLQSRWRRLQRVLGLSRWMVAAVTALAVLGGGLEATLLGLVAHVAAAISSGDDVASLEIGPVHLEAGLWTLLVVALVLAGTRLIERLVSAWIPAKMSTDAQHRMKLEMYRRFLDAPYGVQAKEREGRLVQAVSGYVSRVAVASVDFADIIAALATFLTMVVAAFVLSPAVALLVLVSSGLMFLGLLPLARVARRYSDRLSKLTVELTQAITESARLVEEVRVYRARPSFIARTTDLVEAIRVPSRRSSFLRRAVPAVYQGVVFLLLVVGIMVVYAVGAQGLASLGAVVLVLIRASAYGQRAQTGYHRMAEVAPFVQRIEEASREFTPDSRDAGAAVPLERVRTIAFDHVGFSYVPGRPALTDVDVDIAAGETVGIVGPSGAGKSTFVQLLLRLRYADRGAVRINGIDLADIHPGDWWPRIAYVSQEPRLLQDTVAENIRFFRDSVTQTDVVRAAKLAHIHEDVETWPGGYDHVVGHRANAVSGGQRQRIALARALAERPEVLVLDEPTSALDLRSEQLIQRSLEELRGSTTLFIIAHRLTTVTICDRVLVLRDGHLEAVGDPSSLALENEFFREASIISAGVGSGLGSDRASAS